MARPLRLQFNGALYHLLVRANHRQLLFRDYRDMRRYLQLLSRYRNQLGYRLYAYVLMNRYVHLLIETPKGNVSQLMQRLGTSYTSYFNRRHKRRGTIFEGRYKSSLVDKKSCLLEVTRYIHRVQFQSPRIKKKRDYPWSSYAVYLGRRASNLVDIKPVLDSFSSPMRAQRRRYEQFVEKDHVKGTCHPEKISSQQIVGPSDFVKRVSSFPLDQKDNEEEPPLKKAEQILRAVSLAQAANLDEDIQKWKKRVLTRHVAMYLLRSQTTLPLRSIGEILGVKAPAVAVAVGKVEQLLERDQVSKNVKELLKSGHPQLSDKAEKTFVPKKN